MDVPWPPCAIRRTDPTPVSGPVSPAQATQICVSDFVGPDPSSPIGVTLRGDKSQMSL